jgi:ferredoxin
MRVTVDAKRCQGHTLCAMAAPNVFELSGDDGHASVPRPRVPPNEEGNVRHAADSCPELAVVIEES